MIETIFRMTGLSNKQLAEIFDKSERVIYNWRKQREPRLSNQDWEQFQKLLELVLELEANTPEECSSMLLDPEKSLYLQLTTQKPRNSIS